MSAPAAIADPLHTAPPSRLHSVGFSLAWTLVGAAALAVGWVLCRVWLSLPEMNDRFLIPLAAAWLVKRDLSRWRARPAQPTPLGLILVAAGALLAPPPWFLLVQVGPRVILLW